MNFYKHYIGDYQRDTGHLSLTEHGAYRLMLDAFYATGRPLPAERKVLYRLLRAEGRTERAAIDSVASQFWDVSGNGLVNKRAVTEIRRAEKQAETNRQIALAREEKRRKEREGVQGAGEPSGMALPGMVPDKCGTGVPENVLDVPFGVSGVSGVDGVFRVDGWQGNAGTVRGTDAGTPDAGMRLDGGAAVRVPNHSQNHNHSQNRKDEASHIRTEMGCGNFATVGDMVMGPQAAGRLAADGVQHASVLLATAMREEGVAAAGADPRVMGLARQGVSAEVVRAACAEARRARPDERIGAAYVVRIVERWLREGRDAPVGTAGMRGHGVRRVSDARQVVMDVLTGRNTVDGVARTVGEAVPVPEGRVLPDGRG